MRWTLPRYIHNACDKPDCHIVSHSAVILLSQINIIDSVFTNASCFGLLQDGSHPDYLNYGAANPSNNRHSFSQWTRNMFSPLLEDLSFRSKTRHRNPSRANLKHLTQALNIFVQSISVFFSLGPFPRNDPFLWDFFLKKMCHFLVSTLCSTKSFQFSLFFDFGEIFYPLLSFQRNLLPHFFFRCQRHVWRKFMENREAIVSNTLMGKSKEYYRKERSTYINILHLWLYDVIVTFNFY